MARKGWNEITAVKNGAILNLQNNELSRPTPRLADGAQLMFDSSMKKTITADRIITGNKGCNHSLVSIRELEYETAG